jgi:hypothetical protein
LRKKDLTPKQRQAWGEYCREEGFDWDAVPEDTNIDELIRGEDPETYRSKTLKGGYKEIPEELLLREAKRIGFTGRLPQVKVDPEALDAEVEIIAPGKCIIKIPERTSKASIPHILRHELAHLHLGHLTKSPKTVRTITSKELMENELQASRLAGDSWIDALINNAVTAVVRDDFDWEEIKSVLYELQPELGIPSRSLRSAVNHVDNFLIRYGLED